MTEVITTHSRPVNYSLGAVYDFLAEKLPECRTDRGVLDVTSLAKACKLSEEAIYKCFRKDRLTTGVARKLVDVADGRIKPEELTVFILA